MYVTYVCVICGQGSRDNDGWGSRSETVETRGGGEDAEEPQKEKNCIADLLAPA